jgi:hypothetical protein
VRGGRWCQLERGHAGPHLIDGEQKW